MTDGTIRVLCVDDNEHMRAALTRIVNLEPRMEMVGTLDRADGVVPAVRAQQPDVVLMDLVMEGRNSMETVAELSQVSPEVRVIVFTAYGDDVSMMRALNAGAWGFVSKSEDPQRLLDAIRRVNQGEVVLGTRNGPRTHA